MNNDSLRLIRLYEHWGQVIEHLEIKKGLYFKKDNNCPVFQYENKTENDVQNCTIKANYYIGVGTIPNGHHIFISPKVNNKLLKLIHENLDNEDIDNAVKAKIENEDEIKSLPEVDVIKMLSEIVKLPNVTKEISALLDIDWNATEIELEHLENDYLSPFLVLQFLYVMKTIVNKGLKKSYYTVEENLNSRIKGKILVPQTIKLNHLKNRLTNTYCKYQEFGFNSVENQFLKKVLEFVKNYLSANKELLSSANSEIHHTLNYISSAFDLITPLENIREIKSVKHNKFYKEYKDAIQLGELILKNFSYSITKSNKTKRKTPPYWIDMSRLFELYAYKMLLENSEYSQIKYHWRTFGNEVDFIGFYKNPDKKNISPVIIDAKYKLHYENSKEHQDMRQVAGYSRLKKVYDYFSKEISNTEIIDCIIIYPTLNKDIELKISEIKSYQNIYKMGICLPIKNSV